MKKILIILFILFTANLKATVYYVAPTGGSDSNTGTNISLPWATWQKAFETAYPGDTVYFRGGVWYPTTTVYGNEITTINPRANRGRNGEPGNPIWYLNYPTEKPILDCRNVVAPTNVHSTNRWLTGLHIEDAHWINFRGLTIRNVYQRDENVHARGIVGWPFSNMNFENITVHNIGSEGWYMENDVGYQIDPATEQQWIYGWDDTGYVPYDTSYFKNCDTYQCVDSLSANEGNEAGNMGDGFKIINGGGYVTFENCRAWYCSDDGFDMPGHGVTRFFNVWSFANGYTEGEPLVDYEGNGMKSGASHAGVTSPRRIYANCVFAYNRRIGLFVLEYPDYDRSYSRIYNITSYKNETGFVLSQNPAWTDSESIIRNSIVYGSTGRDHSDRMSEVDAQSVYLATTSNFRYALVGSVPRWEYNPNFPASDADFEQTSFEQCISQMTAARKSDNSLPDITFLRLKDTSPLKEAGAQIPVGDNSGISLTFEGTAPDIGYSQVGYESGPVIDPPVSDKAFRIINGKPAKSTRNNLLYYIK